MKRRYRISVQAKMLRCDFRPWLFAWTCGKLFPLDSPKISISDGVKIPILEDWFVQYWDKSRGFNEQVFGIGRAAFYEHRWCGWVG
jgi:hypothetical protein